MNKQEVLKEYKKQEERLLLSFVLDKIKFVENRNKIEDTNFLNIYEISLVQNFMEEDLMKKHIENMKKMVKILI